MIHKWILWAPLHLYWEKLSDSKNETGLINLMKTSKFIEDNNYPCPKSMDSLMQRIKLKQIKTQKLIGLSISKVS